MSQLSDAIAAANVSADEAILRVQEDVKDLNNKIAELQQKIDEGNATPQDMENLAALRAKLDALDPTKPDVIPTE